ncbi:MAG: hypothetical protein LAN59_07075 [Acidobacteriia bacterium]|nr:hypothetical protein [Terriglobia bacterium]
MRKQTRRSRRTLASALATVFVLLGGAFLFALAAAPRAVSAAQQVKPAAEKAPDLKSFTGTWKASFQGEVFAILILKEKGGDLTGTLNNFDISLDKEGNLAPGTHKDQGDAPLLNVRFKSGALYFVAIQKDQYNPSTEWKFVPTSAQEAELTQLIDNQPYATNGVPAKPIRMLREHAKP